MMKKISATTVVAVLAIVILVLAEAPQPLMAQGILCNQAGLYTSCIGYLNGYTITPSATCCREVRQETSCLCQNRGLPSLTQFIRVAGACGLPIPAVCY